MRKNFIFNSYFLEKKYLENLFGNSGEVSEFYDQELVSKHPADTEKWNTVIDSLIKQ